MNTPRGQQSAQPWFFHRSQLHQEERTGALEEDSPPNQRPNKTQTSARLTSTFSSHQSPHNRLVGGSNPSGPTTSQNARISMLERAYQGNKPPATMLSGFAIPLPLCRLRHVE
jgi:hypothetical protein